MIDYFYDMSLLKEGDSVNFQKASCTLDGCVKIYTSRVDSVATETGKLLSGLADSGSKKRKGEDADGGDGEEEDEEEGEEGVKKRARKRAQRSSEATLAPSFAQLQLKKMELEFAVDPLFKKASADFDEGGAKGLLLNHLTIDAQGRIVFDSSDDLQQEGTEADLDSIQEQSEEQGEEAKSNDKTNSPPSGEADVDLESLGLRFFPDLDRLDDQDICPSLKTFELGGATDSLDIPFLKAPDDWKKDSPEKRREEGLDDMLLDDGMGGGMDDDDDNDGGMGGFDLAADVGFGEGGEAWAKEAAIDTQLRPHYEPHQNDMDDETGDGRPEDVGGYDPNSSQYGVHLSRDKDFDRENILSYFDQAQQKNWAGPEHWRIRKIKDASKPAAPTTKRKEKEPFEIDFAAPMTQAMADMIYTPASSNSAISLPKSQWKSKTRNLLPDDKHFNSRQLLSLFLKPKARIGSRRLLGSSGQQRRDQLPEGELDEAYWARQQNAAATSLDADESVAQGNYDANFFQDDGLGAVGMADDEDDGVFADAQERLSPSADQQPLEPGSIDSMVPEGGTQPDGGFGSQLVTQSRRLRPEYVQYARVAKKVDVRRLKEEMWRGIGFQDVSFSSPLPKGTSSPNLQETTLTTCGCSLLPLRPQRTRASLPKPKRAVATSNSHR